MVVQYVKTVLEGKLWETMGVKESIDDLTKIKGIGKGWQTCWHANKKYAGTSLQHNLDSVFQSLVLACTF